jgi:polar amino acid transport system substrate-binding protein
LLVGFGPAGTVAAQTYTVGTAIAPFGFVDSATGEPAGYSVDVMGAIAEDAGFDITFTVFPTFGELLPALLDGSVDIAAGPSTVTAARVDMGIAFSGVYARHTDALIVLGTDTQQYTSVNDLAGEAVGADNGTIYWDYLKKVQESGVPFKEVVDTAATSDGDQAEALRQGIVKGELTASFRLPFEQMRGEWGDIRAVETYVPVLPSATAIAVREADTDLLGVIQASLSKLLANGTLAELTEEWGINPP